METLTRMFHLSLVSLSSTAGGAHFVLLLLFNKKKGHILFLKDHLRQMTKNGWTYPLIWICSYRRTNYSKYSTVSGCDLNLGLRFMSVVLCFSEPGVVVFPEPWLLYVALLLVPITILLGLVTVLLMCRSWVCKLGGRSSTTEIEAVSREKETRELTFTLL